MNSIIPDISRSELLKTVIAIAGQASDHILDIYKTEFTVEKKGDHSPVTAADIGAHKIICQRLTQLDSQIPVLSEESVDIPYSTRKSWQRYWLVDPLDGTREFIKRNGEFTVNIALIEQHQPVLGVVYVPVTGLCYFATRGHGAYKQTKDETVQQIHVKTTSPEKFIVAGSRSHSSEKQKILIELLGKDTKLISVGSSLKFCLIAEGEADIYPRFGPTSEWDTAAAQCIVEAAGGMVTDMQFNSLSYNTKKSLINPGFVVIADKTFDWVNRIKMFEDYLNNPAKKNS